MIWPMYTGARKRFINYVCTDSWKQRSNIHGELVVNNDSGHLTIEHP